MKLGKAWLSLTKTLKDKNNTKSIADFLNTLLIIF
jgi:hypothetical protein